MDRAFEDKIPTAKRQVKKRGLKNGKAAFSDTKMKLSRVVSNASAKKLTPKLLRDAVAMTIKAASSRSSIHSARKRTKNGRSERQIMRALEGLDLESVTKEVNLVLRKDAKKEFGGQTLSFAIDIHQIPYHGKPYKDDVEISRNKQKEGTTKFHSMATAYIVGKGRKRFTLAAVFVPAGTTMRDIVWSLIRLLRKCNVQIDYLLLDKGFYSIDVVRLLMRLNIGFIIPMRGNRLKKEKRSYQTTYNMKSRRDGKIVVQSVNAISVIKYNRGKRFRHHGAMQLCFIIYRIPADLRQTAELYRKRFGIESSYKLNKAIRSRTSTRNPAIRMFLFCAAVIIQNVWVGVKLQFCKRINRASPLMITLRDFADVLLYWVRKQYGENAEIG